MDREHLLGFAKEIDWYRFAGERYGGGGIRDTTIMRDVRQELRWVLSPVG